MKAETLKRLFRLIQDSSHPGLSTIAQTIVDDERRVGHGSLAAQLEKILAQARPAKQVKEPTLAALPDNGRNAKAFTSWLPPEILRHHMVLPSRVEARFQRIEREYVARDRLARHGLNYRKRILLHGPPGCGKTLGAERLGWTTGLPLMKVRLDAVMSSYFGESAANLRSIFESVRTFPTLLFLDECDFVGRSRTNTNDVGEVPRIVNTLLVLLEEYQGPGMVVAATNLDSALDRALFRRFDEILEIPPPGLDEISALLRLTLSAIPVDDSMPWDAIAESLLGASAANVVKVAQDAAKAALLDERKTVTESDLQEAVKELERNG
jgi:SpoVK/Ycf46/Vps4 family AAA+-type ATPase